jgi:phosphate transport system ATP-binding protein
MTSGTQTSVKAETSPAALGRPTPAAAGATFDVQGLNAWFGDHQVLFDISLRIQPKVVTAIIGPSGCGKTTFLRSLNRMHELVTGARLEGHVTLLAKTSTGGKSIPL